MTDILQKAFANAFSTKQIKFFQLEARNQEKGVREILKRGTILHLFISIWVFIWSFSLHKCIWALTYIRSNEKNTTYIEKCLEFDVLFSLSQKNGTLTFEFCLKRRVTYWGRGSGVGGVLSTLRIRILSLYQMIQWTISHHGPLFTNKTPSYQYRDSHYKPETVVRPS